MTGTDAEAVAIRAGRIAVVGGLTEARAAAGPGATEVELAGRPLLPGFVDPHHHLALAALLAGAVDGRPATVKTADGFRAAVAEAAARSGPDDWVVVTGHDPFKLRGRIDRADLDEAGGGRPVMVMFHTFHQAFANSPALALAGVGRETPDPPGGRIERGRKGEPTGRLIEAALHLVEHLARAALVARGGLDARLDVVEAAALAEGITCIADAAVPPAIEAVLRARHARGGQRLGIVMMPICEHGWLTAPWTRLDGPSTGDGDELLRVGALKLVLDGADDCAVCMSTGQVMKSGLRTLLRVVTRLSFAPIRGAMRGSLRRSPDGKWRSGILIHEEEKLHALLQAATERGFDVAMHAAGNEAVEHAVCAAAAFSARRKIRIEHTSFIPASLLPQLADCGATLVVQPRFVELPGPNDLPPVPFLVFPLRSLIDAGAPVASSSDAPVTSGDPLAQVRAAVTRKGARGAVGPEEAIEVVTALALVTREAAKAAGTLDVRGTLEPGKRADLVVLSSDPRTSLDGCVVAETWLGGERVYTRVS